MLGQVVGGMLDPHGVGVAHHYFIGTLVVHIGLALELLGTAITGSYHPLSAAGECLAVIPIDSLSA